MDRQINRQTDRFVITIPRSACIGILTRDNEKKIIIKYDTQCLTFRFNCQA